MSLAPAGFRSGRLVVIGPAPRAPLGRHARVTVRCDCGTEKTADANAVARGVIKSCGCLVRENRVRGPVDRTGQTFYRLTILEHLSRGAGALVRCRCACGREHVALTANVVQGQSRSCGCLLAETRRAVLTTHGLSGHALFGTWTDMRDRCGNPLSKAYRNYGGRGIDVCAGWSGKPEHGFANFVRDMGEKPSPEMSIDRRNNDKGYWCGLCDECRALGREANCRWATRYQQSRNTRSNVWIEVDGVARLASEVCDENGVSRQLFHVRAAHGWDLVRAATQPPNPKMGGGGFRRMSKARRRRVAAMGTAARRANGWARTPVTEREPRPVHLVFGDGYVALADLARALGRSEATIAERIRRGATAAELMATLVPVSSVDRGAWRVGALATLIGCSNSTIYNRLRSGETPEQIIAHGARPVGRPRKHSEAA